MRHAEGAMFQDSRAKERCQWAWFEGGGIVGGRRRRVGEVLECLVCAQSVTLKSMSACDQDLLSMS